MSISGHVAMKRGQTRINGREEDRWRGREGRRNKRDGNGWPSTGIDGTYQTVELLPGKNGWEEKKGRKREKGEG